MTTISQLTQTQREHLAWRLDHKTYCGHLTACQIARGERGNMDLVKLFQMFGKTLHSAKIHAAKVRKFEL